jgi:hypothetical protein
MSFEESPLGKYFYRNSAAGMEDKKGGSREQSTTRRSRLSQLNLGKLRNDVRSTTMLKENIRLTIASMHADRLKSFRTKREIVQESRDQNFYTSVLTQARNPTANEVQRGSNLFSSAGPKIGFDSLAYSEKSTPKLASENSDSPTFKMAGVPQLEELKQYEDT